MKLSANYSERKKQRKNNFFYRKKSKRMLEIALLICLLALLTSIFQVSAENWESAINAKGTFENFGIESDQNSVSLSWVNTGVIKDECYIILRSSDNISFVPVGMRLSNTPEQGRAFSFSDRQPLYGKSYYKICRASLEGETKFSPVKCFVSEDSKAVQTEIIRKNRI